MRITGKEIKAGDIIGDMTVSSTRTTQEHFVALVKLEDETYDIVSYGKDEQLEIKDR